MLVSGTMSTAAIDLLRQHGVQVTVQRLAVLRAVSGEPHITADGVAEAVRTELGTISRQSVYDALTILVDVGLLRRIQPAGSPARYEDRVSDNHHHLICRACGSVVDVDCATGSAPCLTAADDMGFRIDEAEVAYWGLCPQCLTAAGNGDDGAQDVGNGPASRSQKNPGSRPTPSAARGRPRREQQDSHV